jgi:hypothetical protein
MKWADSEHSGAALELVVLPQLPIVFWAGPARRFHPAWMYCSILNDSEEPIFVYGPRHKSDTTKIPTSLFLLPAKTRSPHFWDCKGVLVPMGQNALVQNQVVHGPVALKYRDVRWIRVQIKDGVYYCPRPNGVLTSEQIDFPALHLTYEELLACPRRLVRVR